MPFNSYKFRSFAQEWGIRLTTSSPTYAQSNGLSERTVQTMKHLLQKADHEGKDPYIALLELRNTPITGTPFSPAQVLMGRRLRDKLPATAALLSPKVVNVSPYLRQNQLSQKTYYDRSTRDREPFRPGDVVRMRLDNKTWQPAIVTAVDHNPRSYLVNQNGQTYRRNQQHLVATREPPAQQLPLYDDLPAQHTAPAPDHAGSAHQVSQPQLQPENLTTRSGREVRVPDRFSDFICSKK